MYHRRPTPHSLSSILTLLLIGGSTVLAGSPRSSIPSGSGLMAQPVPPRAAKSCWVSFEPTTPAPTLGSAVEKLAPSDQPRRAGVRREFSGKPVLTFFQTLYDLVGPGKKHECKNKLPLEGVGISY